jgi:hypothetical protein
MKLDKIYNTQENLWEKYAQGKAKDGTCPINSDLVAKLVKQAGISRSQREMFDNWDDIDRKSAIGWYMCVEDRFITFVELIVRECANVAEKAQPHKSGDDILKRFGIKETK